jgi:hypothetical protein
VSVVNVVVSQDFRGVGWLRDFVRADADGGLDVSHPLATGFAAVRKELAGLVRLTPKEREAAARLRMAVTLIKENEEHWRPHESRFAADLRDSAFCKSLLFELHVMTFAVKPIAQGVRWLHYEHGTPDIEGLNPNMLVECTLVRNPALTLARLKRELSAKRRQHGNLQEPYVIAIGFDSYYTREEIARVEGLVSGLKPWFRSHLDVAAGLIFTPLDPSSPPAQTVRYPVLLSGSVALHGAVTEVIHHAASNPLPRGFTFNVTR